MKSSLWFEASMLALILVASVMNGVGSDSARGKVAADGAKNAAQLKTSAHYSMTNAYL
jgi:hypothetical protein